VFESLKAAQTVGSGIYSQFPASVGNQYIRTGLGENPVSGLGAFGATDTFGSTGNGLPPEPVLNR